jgi:hypothetical protein
MINANGLAELRSDETWWGERIAVCTECGAHPVHELRTTVAGRQYHNCTGQPITYWSDRLGQYVTVPAG